MNRIPGQQTQKVMKEKEQIARALLARGLTVNQIHVQLRCSPAFIRKVRREMEGADGNAA